MHAIDEAILSGTLTPALLAEHAAKPLPQVGHSYWGDHMHSGLSPERAAIRAARDMGAGLASLQSISR